MPTKARKTTVYDHTCTRCCGEWTGGPNPKRCAKCGNPYWNDPPTRPNAKDRTVEK